MTFRIEVLRTKYYVHSDEVDTWSTDPHWEETEELEYNSDMKLDYESPVEWAVAMLGNERIAATPGMAEFPSLEPSTSPIGDAVRSHEWLYGTAGDNYTNEETSWTIRFVSPEWTDGMRAEIFKRATSNH